MSPAAIEGTQGSKEKRTSVVKDSKERTLLNDGKRFCGRVGYMRQRCVNPRGLLESRAAPAGAVPIVPSPVPAGRGVPAEPRCRQEGEGRVVF